MRLVTSKIRINRSAEEVWRLRCSYELEEYIACVSQRSLTLVEERSVEEGTKQESKIRTVRCELLGEHLGGLTLGALSSKDLVSEISSNFFTHLFDEDHGASFTVEMLKVRLDVRISGTQHCIPESSASCFLCTNIRICVNVLGIGSLVEMQLQRQLQASHAAFPQHVVNFEKQLPTELTEPAAPEFEHRALPARFVPISAAPSCHQISRSYAGHHALDQIKVGRRTAWLLVTCGCASLVVDEIIE